MRDAWDKERALKTTLYQKCIADQRLDLLTEWDGEKNAPLSPWTVSYGSKKRVWWTCPDGHVWKAMVYSRGSVQRSGCPICAGQGRRSRTLHRYTAADAMLPMAAGADRARISSGWAAPLE